MNDEREKEFEFLSFFLFNVTVIQTLSILKEERRIWRKHSAHQSINFTSENDIIRPIRREIYILNISARATFARRCTRVRIERAIRPSFSHLSGSSGRVLLSRPSPPPTHLPLLPSKGASQRPFPSIQRSPLRMYRFPCEMWNARTESMDGWIGR